MADSGGTDIVAGMAAVPAAGSGISDAQLYITGTGGIRGRPLLLTVGIWLGFGQTFGVLTLGSFSVRYSAEFF